MPRSQEEIRKDINYDESKVPAFELPSPLERPDGGRVTTAYEWVNRRRGEVLDFYKKEVYGQLPPRRIEQVYQAKPLVQFCIGGCRVAHLRGAVCQATQLFRQPETARQLRSNRKPGYSRLYDFIYVGDEKICFRRQGCERLSIEYGLQSGSEMGNDRSVQCGS